MRKDNNVNYNTDQSDVKPFSDVLSNVDKEKDSLKKDKRNYLNNEDDKYNLPNKKRLRFNKVTKTWQDSSKKEVKDKLKSLEKIRIKSFDEVVNEDNYAFGSKQLTSETFLMDLKNDIYRNQSNLDNLTRKSTFDPNIQNILSEIKIHFDEILGLIDNRHDFAKKELENRLREQI